MCIVVDWCVRVPGTDKIDMIATLDFWQKRQREVEEELKVLNKGLEEYQQYKTWLEGFYSQWRGSPRLEGVDENYKMEAAIILENQLFYLNQQEVSEGLRTVAMEVLEKMLRGFVGFHLVSVQPILRPKSRVFFSRFKYVGDTLNLFVMAEDMEAKSRKIGNGPYENVDELADKLRDNITQEILRDLRNNSGTIMTKKLDEDLGGKMLYESVYCNIIEMSGVIHRKTLRGGTNWLVMGPDMMKMFQEYGWAMDKDLDLGSFKTIQVVGTVGGRWRLILDPNAPPRQILCGYHDKEQKLASYIYSPYIWLTEWEGPQIIARYGKRLCREGGKCYGLIKYE